MSFRHHKSDHHDRRACSAWKQANATLLARCHLPPGVLRSRRDWGYLLKYGYWCDAGYGLHINKIDFHLDQLTPPQLQAFREPLTATLSDEQKQRGSAGWPFVHPPGP